MWCPPCLAVAQVAYPVGKAVAIRPQVCLAEPCGQRGHRPTSGRLRSLRQLPPFFEANPPLEEHPAAGGAEEREHLLRKDIRYLKKGQAAKRHGKKAREKDRVQDITQNSKAVWPPHGKRHAKKKDAWCKVPLTLSLDHSRRSAHPSGDATAAQSGGGGKAG